MEEGKSGKGACPLKITKKICTCLYLHLIDNLIDKIKRSCGVGYQMRIKKKLKQWSSHNIHCGYPFSIAKYVCRGRDVRVKEWEKKDDGDKDVQGNLNRSNAKPNQS